MAINAPFIDPSLRIRSEKRRLGLLFGLAAGLGLSFGIWGWDAILLSRVNNPDAWLKLPIGVPLVLLLCGLAGWLTARLDQGVLGAAIWLSAGLAVVAVAAWVPFQGLSRLIGWLSPEFAGLTLFPSGDSVQTRMIILMLATGVLMTIAGALELAHLDGLIQASGVLARGFRLVVIAVIFIAFGLLVDGMLNAPLRRPLVAMHELIQYGRLLEAQPGLRERSNMSGLSTLRMYGDMIHQPYQLSLASYDPDSLTETAAHLKFQDTWSICFVVEDTPLNCVFSSERYIRRLACAIESAGTLKCDLLMDPGALEAIQAAASELSGKKLIYGILDQLGNTVLAMVQPEGSDVQYRCVLREDSRVNLETCESTQGKTYLAVDPPPHPRAQTTPQPGATPVAGGAATSVVTPAVESPAATEDSPRAAAGPEAALLLAAQADLASLPDLSDYIIDLTIDPSLEAFDGRLQLSYTNLEAEPLNEVYFRLLPNGHKPYGNGDLRVTSTAVDGQPAETELSLENTVLRVALPQSLPPAGQIRIDLEFAGTVPEDFGGSSTPDGYGIYNLSDGVLVLSGWYPILSVYNGDGWNLDPISAIGDSVYSDTAFYSVRLCAPGDLVLAYTGAPMGKQDEGTNTCTQIESGPVRDFVIAASRDFAVSSDSVDGVTVNSYYLPGHEIAGQKALEIARDSLKTYDEKFGQYPFVELDVIDAPMRNALGVEYPGIILVAQSLYDEPDRSDFDIATAHEVAHQWWYSVIGNDVFEEPWLDEGLTTFSSSLYYEYNLPPDYALGLWGYYQQRYDQLKSQNRDQPVTESLAYFEEDPNRAYGAVVYTKAALFFRALRKEIGDDAFFSALQQYYRTHKYGIARGSDLLDAFEAAAGRQLDDFYQEWLYSPP